MLERLLSFDSPTQAIFAIIIVFVVTAVLVDHIRTLLARRRNDGGMSRAMRRRLAREKAAKAV